MGPSFPVKTGSSPEHCQFKTWSYAKLWKPHSTFDKVSSCPSQKPAWAESRKGEEDGQAWYNAGLQGPFCLGVYSCNNQCVESGVFACQLLELVWFVIWGRGQISGLI